MMDDDGNTNGFVDFEEFASFWLGDDWWLKSGGEDGDSDQAGTAAGLGAQCGQLESFLCRRKGGVFVSGKKKETQVQPESFYVLSADGGAKMDRERGELMDQIQQIHQNEFHQLEDLLNTHAESRV